MPKDFFFNTAAYIYRNKTIMKKAAITFTLVLLATGISQAQRSQEKAMVKGENSINIYYGVSLSKSLYTAVASSGAEDLKVSGIGPVGIMYEHMLSDVVGLGAEFGYSSLKVGWTIEDYNFSTGKTDLYTYEYKFSTIRAMVRANFHFLKVPNFDMYGLVSMGYRQTTFNFTTTDPYFTGSSFKSPIPFGLKPGLGMRYFFTDNIGLNIEIAAGTPVMGGGLSLRF
jgi:opacity protein-like surface antigen